MFQTFSTGRILVCLTSLIICLAAASSARAQASTRARESPLPSVNEQYSQQMWITEQGLPQNSVQCLLQSRDGYLWIGTRDGLARFDGLRFTVFDRRNTAHLLHNQIRGLFEDRAGNLWISTPAGLTRFRHGRFTSFTTNEGLSSNNIWSVLEDRTGNLWIATVNGLNRYRDGKFTTFTTQEGLPRNNIDVILEDREGALWIGSEGGLTRYSQGSFKTFTRQDGLADDIVRTIFQSQAGPLWIGTANGLTRIADGQLTSFSLRDEPAVSTASAGKGVNAIAQDQAGRLFVGANDGLYEFRSQAGRETFIRHPLSQADADQEIRLLQADQNGGLWVGFRSGVMRYQDNRWWRYGEREEISGNVILSILQDREGCLWFGTDNDGLHVLRRKKFNTWTRRDGLAGNLVKSVYEDRTGSIWAGVQEGGLSEFKNGKWTTWGNSSGFMASDVMSLCDDRAGNLWIGTREGLHRFRQGSVRTFTTQDGLADNFVRSLYEDRSGNLWIGTRRGLMRFYNNVFTSYSALDGLPGDLVGALCESRDGSLWIGTVAGLSHFENGQFTNYDVSAGLSDNVVISLYEDGDGNLWIGTLGGGLNRLRDGRFSHYTVKDGLPDDVIYQILEDDQHFLWMGTNKGIVRVDRRELERLPSTAAQLSAASHSSAQNTPATLPQSPGQAEHSGRLQTGSLYTTADGLESRECSSGGHPAGWKTRDGRLWFATTRGVAMIDPARLSINRVVPPVAIEQVVVDDVPLASEKMHATASESAEPSVEIAPGNHRLEFYFTALSFLAPQKNTFKYKLEGYDQDWKEWVETGSRRMVSYTNIPSGRYRFRVLAGNNDGVWNETGAAFEFYLQPRFYQSLWFYALCIPALALVVALGYRARVRRLQREFSAVLAERARIAREIHDTLAQSFAAISLQLELITRLIDRSPQTAKTYLEQARSLVRESLAEARRSVWDLRSQALTESDLPTALNQTAQRLVAGTSTQVQVQVSGAFRQLDRLIEDNLLRIGQEAITNAVKHAQATAIQVNLEFEARRLRLIIRDNGCGFDSSAILENPDRRHSLTQKESGRGGFGLIGMRERAAQIGGHLHISSRPGQGTEIQVEVSLNA